MTFRAVRHRSQDGRCCSSWAMPEAPRSRIRSGARRRDAAVHRRLDRAVLRRRSCRRRQRSRAAVHQPREPVAGRTNQLQQAADVMFPATRVSVHAAQRRGRPTPAFRSRRTRARWSSSGTARGARTIPLALSRWTPRSVRRFSQPAAPASYRSCTAPTCARCSTTSSARRRTTLDMFHPPVRLLQIVRRGRRRGQLRAPRRRRGRRRNGRSGGRMRPSSRFQHLATALGAAITNPLAVPVFGAGAFEPTTVTRRCRRTWPAGEPACSCSSTPGTWRRRQSADRTGLRQVVSRRQVRRPSRREPSRATRRPAAWDGTTRSERARARRPGGSGQRWEFTDARVTAIRQMRA